MNVVDASCLDCGVAFKWLSGTPRICGQCSALAKLKAKWSETPESVSALVSLTNRRRNEILSRTASILRELTDILEGLVEDDPKEE